MKEILILLAAIFIMGCSTATTENQGTEDEMIPMNLLEAVTESADEELLDEVVTESEQILDEVEDINSELDSLINE